MNPNPTGYPATIQQHANPMLAAAAGYPVQSGSPSNQQFPYYAPNAMAAYPPQMQQQSQARPGHMQQHSFNPMQIQTSGPGGAMMPANMVAPHANMAYSSPSPYHPASIPTTSASPAHSQSPAIPATVSMQMPAQNMTAASNPAMLLAQQQQQQQQQLQFQMQQQQQHHHQQQLQQQHRASSQASQTPPVQQQQQQQVQHQQQAQQQQAQGAPQSPAATARERARVTALLEINSALLQELLNLQAAGKSGGAPQAPSTSTPEQSSSPGPATEPATASSDASKKPSQEYVECLKRLQSNLIYLASVTDRNKKPVSAAPAILSPPPHMNNLSEQYTKLNELFSGVPPLVVAQQQRPSQTGVAAETAV